MERCPAPAVLEASFPHDKSQTLARTVPGRWQSHPILAPAVQRQHKSFKGRGNQLGKWEIISLYSVFHFQGTCTTITAAGADLVQCSRLAGPFLYSLHVCSRLSSRKIQLQTSSFTRCNMPSCHFAWTVGD